MVGITRLFAYRPPWKDWEATGVYWKPVWNILSDGDFELMLAVVPRTRSRDAHHVNAVPGRKTDVNDATSSTSPGLADLLAHGLVRGSFVPDMATQEQRGLLRTRPCASAHKKRTASYKRR